MRLKLRNGDVVQGDSPKDLAKKLLQITGRSRLVVSANQKHFILELRRLPEGFYTVTFNHVSHTISMEVDAKKQIVFFDTNRGSVSLRDMKKILKGQSYRFTIVSLDINPVKSGKFRLITKEADGTKADLTPEIACAIECDHLEALDLILKASPDLLTMATGEMPALHLAVARNKPISLKHLLKHFVANIHVQDEIHQTPLQLAIEKNAKLEIVKTLLDHGADINAKNNGGSSPLFFAIASGRVDLVKLLLTYKHLDLNLPCSIINTRHGKIVKHTLLEFISLRGVNPEIKKLVLTEIANRAKPATYEDVSVFRESTKKTHDSRDMDASGLEA